MEIFKKWLSSFSFLGSSWRSFFVALLVAIFFVSVVAMMMMMVVMMVMMSIVTLVLPKWGKHNSDNKVVVDFDVDEDILLLLVLPCH